MKMINWKKWGTLTLVLLILKGLFSFANINQLQWLLTPIVYLVEICTAIDFIWEPNIGYTSYDNIIIEKSCSGGNFFIICLLLFFIKKWNPFHLNVKALKVFSIFIIAFGITIITNTMRIVSAIKLASFNTEITFINHKSSHLLLGSIIYIFMLLSINYLITTKYAEAS